MNDIFAFIMVQVLKENIRESIINAALHDFAIYGFSDASIANIAKRAGISTGNVYRYFSDKLQLFEAAIPRSFVHDLLKRIRQRVKTYPKGIKPNAIPDCSKYLAISEELLEFTIENRLRVLVILEGASNTPYELFSKKLQTELINNAIVILNVNKQADNYSLIRFLLEQIYQNFLHSLGAILHQYSKASEIHSAFEIMTRYHLNGLSEIIK